MPPMNPMMGMGMPMMPGYVGYQFPMPGMMDPMGAYPQSVMTGIPPNVGGAPVGKEETVEHKITLHFPGMPRPFDAPFPERRLPVCDRCKRNYKSRDLCRTRDGHKTLPWTNTYIAITVDKSAVIEEEDGTMTYADIPLKGELMDTPLMCLGPADGSMKSEPICKVCREKNYTRDYCRNTCKHTTPPWSTTYIKVMANTDPNAAKETYTSGKPNKRRKKSTQAEDEIDGKIKLAPDDADGGNAFAASYIGSPTDEQNSDDLTQIHQSMTFLATVSSKSVIARWCERIQYPETSSQDPLENILPPMPTANGAAASASALADSNPEFPGASNFMNNPGGMNTQLWEAFRAGAMWAQAQHNGGGGGHGMPSYGQYGMPPGAMPGMGGGADAWGGGYPGMGGFPGMGGLEGGAKKVKDENESDV